MHVNLASRFADARKTLRISDFVLNFNDELVDFCVVFTNGTDRFQVYTAGEEAKLYKITTEHAKEKFITEEKFIAEFERLWTEDQTAEEMAESGIALIEEAINYAKTWEDKSFGARLRTIFK